MSGRTRGRPPRISQDQIVAAARSVATRDLTMQAVADALGVSRKALHYYVGDREGLLTLMVLDRFERELALVELPADDDWRVTLRAYAVAFRDGLIQVGAATDFTQLRGLSTVGGVGAGRPGPRCAAVGGPRSRERQARSHGSLQHRAIGRADGRRADRVRSSPSPRGDHRGVDA